MFLNVMLMFQAVYVSKCYFWVNEWYENTKVIYSIVQKNP